MTIIKDYLPISKRRSGQKLLGVKFVVCHDVGNSNSTARGNVNFYKSTPNGDASAQVFIDDKEIIECIPVGTPDNLGEKAWHVRRNVPIDNQLFGVDANDYAIGVELCYFPNDYNRSKQAYDNYVVYIADLCRKYALQPPQHLVGHYRLDPTRRTDPLNAFKHISKTWQQFIQDVNLKFNNHLDEKLDAICQPEKEEINRLKVWINQLLSFIAKWYTK